MSEHAARCADSARLLGRLGKSPRDVMRRGEDAYRDNGPADPALDDAALIAAMVAHPMLIERPIVVAGDKAALGRPPEPVLEILSGRFVAGDRATDSVGGVARGNVRSQVHAGQPRQSRQTFANDTNRTWPEAWQTYPRSRK